MSDVIAPERLSAIIGMIYDCAVDPGLWPHTLEHIMDATDCTAGSIFLVDLGSGRGSILAHARTETKYVETWLRHVGDMKGLWEFDPLVTSRHIDEPLVLSRDVPLEVAYNMPVYHEWAKPQGLCDGLQTIVLRTRGRLGVLAISRHESVGLLSEREITIMRLLAPHIRRAVTVGDLLDMAALRVATFDAALDALGSGILFVGEGGVILETNAAARDMLAEGGAILARNGRLAAASENADAELQRAIGMARKEEAALAGGGISVGIAGQGLDAGPAIAHVLPLARGDLRTRLVPEAVAGVFVTRGDAPAQPDFDAVSRSLGLTAAEAKLLAQLAAGHSLVESARVIGIAEATAKTQLAGIFQKAGVSRQADLLALVARLTPNMRS